jgi:hypothetical protein
MSRLQQFGGGAFGAGGTIAAREFADEPGDSRFAQPSVLFGLGTGTLAAALYAGHRLGRIETPVLEEDFWGAHALTALPTGAFYAAFPKQANQSTSEQVAEAFRNRLGSGNNSNGSASAEGVRIERAGNSGSAHARPR